MENEQPIDGMNEVGGMVAAVVPLPEKGPAVLETKIVILPFEKRTVFGPSGKADIGVITDEIAAAVGCQPGSVRLLNGVERNGGFGCKHIESHASRIKQFEGLGHRSVFHYCLYVAGGFEAVALQTDGRIVLIRREHQTSHQLICQWDEDLLIWSVTTAIPKRHERGMSIMWEIGN